MIQNRDKTEGVSTPNNPRPVTMEELTAVVADTVRNVSRLQVANREMTGLLKSWMGSRRAFPKSLSDLSSSQMTSSCTGNWSSNGQLMTANGNQVTNKSPIQFSNQAAYKRGAGGGKLYYDLKTVQQGGVFLKGANVETKIPLNLPKEQPTAIIRPVPVGNGQGNSPKILPTVALQQNRVTEAASVDQSNTPIKTSNSPVYSPKTSEKYIRQNETQRQPTSNEKDTKESIIKATQNQGKSSLKLPNQLAVVQFELEEFILPFNSPPLNTLSDAKREVSHWLADLYHQLCHETFRGYYSRHLSESEYRVFFTHSLSLNFEQMTRHFHKDHRWLWCTHRSDIIEHFEEESNKCIHFMQVKYPLKRKTFVSEEGREALPVIDLSSELEFDVMYQTNTSFEYDESMKGYEPSIKVFLNRLVEQTKEHYPRFRKLMKELFTLRNGKILYNRIGMKFRENMPTYSKEEISKEGITIKAPQILRVVIKWAEELERRVAALTQGSLLGAAFRRKSDQLDPQGKHQLRNNLLKKAEKNKMMDLLDRLNTTKESEQELRRRIQSLMGMIPDFIDRYQPHFPYLKSNEVRNGLFNYALSESVSNLSTKYLVFLIHFLERLSTELHKFQVKTKKEQEAPDSEFEFVRFNVGDLLRSKCSGTLAEIKEVYERLSNHSNFTVYRIKNRLETSNRDFLVNAKFKNTPLLCEIQLAVMDSANTEEKELYLDHFSHFLYELSRAKYGPVGQAVVINTSLTEISNFFEQQLKQLVIPHISEGQITLTVEVTAKKMGFKGFTRRSNVFSFICSRCREFKKAHHSYYGQLDNRTSHIACEAPKGTDVKFEKIVCGECVHSMLPPQKRLLFLLGWEMSQFLTFANWEQPRRYLCVLKREAAIYEPKLMTMLNNSFVPVFYRTEKSAPIPMVRAQLEDDSFCLDFKPEVTFLTVDLKELLSRLNGDASIKLAGLNTVKPFNAEQQQEIPRDIIEQELALLYPGLQKSGLREFLSELIHLEMFEIEPHPIVLAVSTGLCMLVDLCYAPEELQELIPRGREFSSLESKMISKNSSWELSSSGIGNRSFMRLKCSKQFDGVQQIDLSDNEITNLTFIKSRSLQTLDLRNNHLKRLYVNETIFPRLVQLNLSSNQITRVEMAEHISLESLILSNNQLRELDVEAWKLPGIRVLDLSNNPSIAEICFPQSHMFSRLRILNLKNDGLKQLTLPRDLLTMEELILEDNQLTELDLSSYSLARLRVLRVARNSLQKLSLPAVLAVLEVLELSANPNLTQIEGRLVNCPQLQRLSVGIKNSDLGNLRVESIIGQAPLLTSIDIDGYSQPTNATVSDPDKKKQSWKVAQISIKNCELKELELTPIQQQFDSLKRISIDSNPALQSIKFPQKMSTVTELALTNSGILEFNSSSCEFPCLLAMSLTKNQLASVKISPSSQTLRTLVLSNNNIHSFDMRQYKFDSLALLDLSNNSLTEILFPAEFPQLSTLIIKHNRLQHLDLGNINAPSLKILDASANCLATLNVSTQHIGKLQQLDLSRNMLRGFYLVGTVFPELQVLQLSHNRLVDFVAYKSQLPNLRALYLDHNSLKMLDTHWMGLSRIQKIDLSYNLLEEIILSQDSVVLPDLSEINFTGNPFNSNIPWSIEQSQKLTPKLKNVHTGSEDMGSLVMWMLEQTPEQARQQYYSTTDNEFQWKEVEQLVKGQSEAEKELQSPELAEPLVQKLFETILESTGMFEPFTRIVGPKKPE